MWVHNISANTRTFSSDININAPNFNMFLRMLLPLLNHYIFHLFFDILPFSIMINTITTHIIIILFNRCVLFLCYLIICLCVRAIYINNTDLLKGFDIGFNSCVLCWLLLLIWYDEYMWHSNIMQYSGFEFLLFSGYQLFWMKHMAYHTLFSYGDWHKNGK